MEAFLFALVVLSFFAPVLVAIALISYHDRLPVIVELLIVIAAILFIAIVQYSWVQNHGTDFLGWWIGSFVVVLIGSLLIPD